MLEPLVLARRSTENIEQKGRRYLIEGRVMVRSVNQRGVFAYVRGHGHLYEVAYERGNWTCTCEARSRCSHVLAVQLVTISQPDDPRVPPGGYSA